MYPLHNSIVKLWIIWEGTEKFNLQTGSMLLDFVVETTKNLMVTIF